MTRIESHPESEREELKKEIIAEVRGDARRRKAIGCGSCAVFYLVILLVGAWLIGSLLARTGFVRVPYLPASLYVPEEPVRQVAPLAGTKPEDVPAIIAAGAKFDPATAKLSIPMKEAALTTVVESTFLSGAANLPFPVERVQVAIQPDFIELFLVSPQEGRKATVRVRFTPSVVGGKVVLTLREFELGKVVLPEFLAEIVFNVVRQAFEDAIATGTASAGELHDIVLSEKQLTLRFSAPRK